MNKIRFNYSLKNIGLPTQNQYRRSLLQKVESVTQRMRWKAHFYLNGETRNDKHFYGLPSNNNAPPVSQLKAFEDDLVKLVQNVSFRKINEPFLNNIKKDLKNIKSSKSIFVFADKTKNIYEVPPNEYDKLLTENITKSYKVGYDGITEDINEELRDISSNLNIGNRIHAMAQTEAFITLKDHKDNFESNPKCRLINPAKSELGRVSKIILDSINREIRSTTNVNQWRNSLSVINWFKEIKNKSR